MESKDKPFRERFSIDTRRWEMWEMERAEYECVQRDMIELGKYHSVGHIEVEKYLAEITFNRFGLSSTCF